MNKHRRPFVAQIADRHRAQQNTPPRPYRREREVTDDDLADTVESAWRTRFGAPTVIAQAQLAAMRRGSGGRS
jgi:hypothetical protein